jgi:hypothetical protein
MPGPGSQSIGAIQRGPQLIADGDNRFFKIGGITVAWPLVTALAAPATFPGGIRGEIGEQWVRIGTPLVLITGGLHVGKYAPLLDAAPNGQGTLTRGRVYLPNRTFSYDDPNSDYAPGGVLYGGDVWEKLIVVPAGFTLTQILAALPDLHTVAEDPI